jgi:hypothetical protein
MTWWVLLTRALDFPALSAECGIPKLPAVVLCSAALSFFARSGILVSILASTPEGPTIVAGGTSLLSGIDAAVAEGGNARNGFWRFC